MGADRLELDVHATADGHVVVHHDPTVERTTSGRGAVAHLSLGALQAFDAGFQFTAPNGSHPHRARGICVPTLAALCDACPGIPLNIEIKQDDPPIEAAVLRVLDQHDARDRTLLAAEHHHIMERIRAAAPGMPTSASATEVADFVRRVQEGDLRGYRPPFAALQVPPAYMGVEIVTTESVRVAHDLGVEVHVWTINERPEMERLLALGVDALMTDFPAIAADVLGRPFTG